MTFAVVHPDGSVDEMPDGADYKDFQAAVGGFIEHIPARNDSGIRAYAHETAAIQSPPQPLNLAASLILSIDVRGTVVLMGGYNEEGDDLPLDAEMWAVIHEAVTKTKELRD